jgi:hypothetical protein
MIVIKSIKKNIFSWVNRQMSLLIMKKYSVVIFPRTAQYIHCIVNLFSIHELNNENIE